MGLRPLARMEIGSCSGSDPWGSASAAFKRIFDIACDYTSCRREKEQELTPPGIRSVAPLHRWAIRHSLASTSCIASTPRDWQNSPIAGPNPSRGVKYASSGEDSCAWRPCICDLGLLARRGGMSAHLGHP